MIIKTGNYALQAYPFVNLVTIYITKGINLELYIIYEDIKYQISVYPYWIKDNKCNYVIIVRKLLTRKFSRNAFSGQKVEEYLKTSRNIICSDIDHFLNTIDEMLNDFKTMLTKTVYRSMIITDGKEITCDGTNQEFLDRFPEFLPFL